MNLTFTRNLSGVAILMCALIACQSGNPTPTPKPFKPTLRVASENVAAGIDVLVRSAYSVEPKLKPKPEPIWTQTSGPGVLEAIDPRNKIFRVFPSDPIKFSTVKTQYNVGGQEYTNEVTLQTYQAPTMLPSAGAGLNAMTLIPYPVYTNFIGQSVFAGDQVLFYNPEYDPVARQDRLKIRKYSRSGILDSAFASAGILSIPGTIDYQEEELIGPVLVGQLGHFFVITRKKNVLKLYKYALDGTPVVTFGTAGTATVTNPLITSGSLYYLLDDLENILVYQSVYKPNMTYDRSIRRLDGLTGNDDVSYGINGVFQMPPSGEFIADGIDFSNGSLLIAGQYSDPGPVRSVGHGLLRVTNAGVLDPNFGLNGMAREPVNVEDAPLTNIGYWYGSKVLADGKILAFGRSGLESSTLPSQPVFWDGALTVTRFLPNGQIDTEFGKAGSTSINVLGNKKLPPNYIKLFVTNNNIVLVQWHIPNFNAGGGTLERPVIVTLSKNGVIEKVNRLLYDPSQTDLTVAIRRDTSRVMDVQALTDGSFLTVGPVCKLVPGAECQPNIGFARFNP